ncbi:MAG: aminotransferase class V-fold PLP-dependent enzyme, partial [Clostridia bacterium]|nr:aminotransferase class V-fold PLP-dependent enzyme [Clostridia bacterium]
METEHYLDQAATTKPSDAALLALNKAAWGNPSSAHGIGRKAAGELKDARIAVGKTFGLSRLSKDRIFFTSCGTESNNIALLGTAASKKRDPARPGTILISAGEHPSVENPARVLEKQGYRILRIPTAGGTLDLGFLEEALGSADSPVIFAGFMLA